MHVADEPYSLWEATEGRSGRSGTPPPFWAFTWPGGTALARLLLDEPARVAGRTVADLGCGGGLVALAAALAGARRVLALDVDPLALVATDLNARLNGLDVAAASADLLALAAAPDDDPLLTRLLGTDVVLAGDLFFERDLARATTTLLRRLAASGVEVLAGDPGRIHLPADAFTQVAAYDVPVAPALEDGEVRRTRVLRLRDR